ncbi:polysaccharide deacetylase family protein [Cyclobacterium marinum]|uniref:Polysaccharide deacetylase n=1 Tax=Cyclobacterium marinum (strain ATCC 25205 / DSM 745 / LMG 13164 / NCIMB 1802) TaxID=880070 RepID=G0IWQ9_CYCMS|nr:polysaccharide deacetylase family protein [Cyclobacterium marinum]AEL24251.1 polysaccharide deacetylase [Cyclobacterium marinum DSM 745]MBR9774678.1 polysaccharide deacetylase family protein [Cytophagales bacterium]|tara:strand:- start:87534 stop:88775 length:1242 start_codon:yes stop_codon:yes gene_type:complete
MKLIFPVSTLIVVLVLGVLSANAQNPDFPWPEGKKMAISLSFDDARASNPDPGATLLNEYGVKATFYVVPASMERNIEGWKMVVETGHEIGNHTLNHPCTGNFGWSRSEALEDYTLNRMRKELMDTNDEVERLLGVRPEVFAYPCGLSFVGKGEETQSYVPLISEMFLSGRGWKDEAPVDPYYADMAQLTGMEMDNMTFEEILPLIEAARKDRKWLVLAGHENGTEGNQTTYLSMLRKLCEYANDPANGVWIAPVGTVAKYVNEKREEMKGSLNIPGITRVAVNETVHLPAEKAKGIGPDIQYMPEWNAFGWFTAKDRVEWDLDLPKKGAYEVWMEWSVSDEEAGKPFIITSGTQTLQGQVKPSGSWETFKKIKVGKLSLEEDYNNIIVATGKEFEQGALMDLKSLILVPITE